MIINVSIYPKVVIFGVGFSIIYAIGTAIGIKILSDGIFLDYEIRDSLWRYISKW